MVGSPTSIPRVTISLSSGVSSETFDDRRDIIFGQIQGGTATANELNSDLQFADDDDILALFGAGEMYWRIRKWREGAQISDGGPIPGLDAVGAATANGTASNTVITFLLNADADGSVTFTLVDEDEFTFTVDVDNTDTPTIAGDAFVTATEALDNPPFTAVNSSGAVTITSNDLSTTGSDYGVRITDNTLSNMTVTLTSSWSVGAGVSDFSNIFDNIEDIRYTGVGWPESWPSADLIAEMDARFNVSNDILDGVAFQGASGTFAVNRALSVAVNSQSLVLIGNNIVSQTNFVGPSVLTPADWVASEFMAIREKRLTTGAIIADFITAANAGFDTTGGPALASLPYFNTEITAAALTPALNLYPSSEQVTLEDDGFTTFGINRSADTMVMGPVVTTRTNDDAGISNTSFQYLNFVDTASVCREVFFNSLKSTFAQTRLTEGNIIPGRSMANEQSIKAELLTIYRALANEALTQAGSDAEAFFSAETTVTVSLSDRLATISGPLPIVSQLETINYSLSLTFDIDASGTFTF